MRISQIAAYLNGRLLGDDGEVNSIEPIFRAGPKDLSVLAWPKDIRLAKRSKAAVLIISSSWAADYADEISASLIIIDDLAHAFLKLSELVKQDFLSRHLVISQKFIHDSASVSKKAFVGKAHIGAQSVVCAGAVISDDVFVGSGCFISAGVFIAKESRLGDNNFVGANSVIGSDAFACFEDQVLRFLGSVVLENNIRIGALCTIDRGLLGATENLVITAY